jgi:ATP-binding cassette subfamily B protein
VGWLLTSLRQWEVSFARLQALLPNAPTETLLRQRPIDWLSDRSAAPPPVEASPAALVACTATGLTYRYPASDRGIHNISLHLPRGSFAVVSGRIGASKTTLLRILLGLLPTESGEIRWNGVLITDPATFFAPPISAYTPQTPRLFSDSLVENILLGLPETAVDLPGAIHQAVLEGDIAQMPAGSNTLIGARGVRLSGGQIQRTAAAGMFVRNAELLVFDDLSSALDVETERLLWERLFALPQRPTCLVVSHLVIRHVDPRPGHEYREEVVDLHQHGDTTGAFGGHGGDLRLVRDFLRVLRGEAPSISTTTLADSVNGHLVGFCADEAMEEGRVVAVEKRE